MVPAGREALGDAHQGAEAQGGVEPLNLSS
jgi:hypothetical protein